MRFFQCLRLPRWSYGEDKQQWFKQDTQHLFLSSQTHTRIYRGTHGHAFSDTCLTSLPLPWTASWAAQHPLVHQVVCSSTASSPHFAGWISYLSQPWLTTHFLENQTFIRNIPHFFCPLRNPHLERGGSCTTADSPANYIHAHFPSYSISACMAITTNISEVFLLGSIYHYAPRLYFSLTCSTQSNINKLSIYMSSFPSMMLIRNLGNAGDLKINLSKNYWHKPELLWY